MEIEIISFGNLSEWIHNQKINVDGIYDTDALKQHLENLFPKLADVKYKLALNKNLVQQNTPISDQDTVALMPPFSGG